MLHAVKLDRLEEIEREVYGAIDHMCLRVGGLLNEARQLNPRGFDRWVDSTLPFGVDKAKRLIAIHLAYSELPEETIAQLPRPWQALYALRSVPIEVAVAAGPETTVEAARQLARRWTSNTPRGETGRARFRSADMRAGDLMNHTAGELSEPVRRSLLRWLDV
jgi:hypothetical protein